MRSLCIVWLALLISGCGSKIVKRRSDGVEVRDVGHMARASHNAALRKRLMVLPFVDEQPTRSERVRRVARHAMLKEIAQTGKFVVISNSDFPRDVSSYLSGGQYDLAAMNKLAFGLGVTALVEGKIQDIRVRKMGDEIGLVRNVKALIMVEVRVRVVSTKNGKEIYNDVRSASVEAVTTRVGERAESDARLKDDPALIMQAALKALAGTTARIARALDRLEWEGRIAMINGDRLYINAGRLSGIQVGDVLKVTEEGKDVFDPETGVLIGQVPGRMKGTIEVISYFGQDGAVAVVHSGSGFSENDRLEMY